MQRPFIPYLRFYDWDPHETHPRYYLVMLVSQYLLGRSNLRLKTCYYNPGADQLPPQPTKGAFVDQATEFVNAGQAAIVTDSEAPESVNTLFYLTKGK
jgi:hypothetical protein